MLADPITVAAASPTPALNFYVIRSDGYGSERKHDGVENYSLIFNHATGKTGDRHYMQIKLSVDAVSPYTGLTSKQTASVSLSVSIPPFGFDDAAQVALIKALTDTLADTDVTSAKFLKFQS